jgi:cytoskeletal protein CcmA (bactofilin family)
MKKYIVLFLLSAATLVAQNSLDLGTFNKVTAFDRIDVTLVESNQNKAIITGAAIQNVQFINKNGELKIRMSLEESFQGDLVSVLVYYKNVDALEANEGARISAQNSIKTSSLELIVKEGAQIDIEIETDRLISKGFAGGEIDINGTANYSTIILTAGAVFNAKNLTTKQTEVTVTAGGEAYVFAKDVLSAKVRAGGSVYYKGKPATLNQKTVAGGTIKQLL